MREEQQKSRASSDHLDSTHDDGPVAPKGSTGFFVAIADEKEGPEVWHIYHRPTGFLLVSCTTTEQKTRILDGMNTFTKEQAGLLMLYPRGWARALLARYERAHPATLNSSTTCKENSHIH